MSGIQLQALPAPAPRGPSPGPGSEPVSGVFLLGAAHVSVGYEGKRQKAINQTFSNRPKPTRGQKMLKTSNTFNQWGLKFCGRISLQQSTQQESFLIERSL